MGLVNDNKCSLCRTEIDYIEHFFFTCPTIKYMWNHVSALFKQVFKINIMLNEKIALFGIVGTEVYGLNKEQINIANNIILIAKMCISKYRYGTPINLITMIEYEMRIRNINYP